MERLKLGEYPASFQIGKYVSDQEINFSPNGRHPTHYELYLKEKLNSKPHSSIAQTYTQAGLLVELD